MFVNRVQQSIEGNGDAVVGLHHVNACATGPLGFPEIHHGREVQLGVDDLVSLRRRFKTRKDQRLANRPRQNLRDNFQRLAVALRWSVADNVDRVAMRPCLGKHLVQRVDGLRQVARDQEAALDELDVALEGAILVLPEAGAARGLPATAVSLAGTGSGSA